MDTKQHGMRGRWRPDLLSCLAYAVLLAATCWLAIHWIRGSLHFYLPKDWSQAHEFDGLEDWLATRFYLQGKNPYTHDSLAELKRIGLGHPPTTGFWFIPFGHLEKAIVAEVFNLVTWFLLLVHLYLCARVVKLPAPAAVAALIFAWMFTTDGMTMHWHAIQVSEQIAFLLVLSWFYLRRGQEIPAGLALGMAATIKLFPGVLMLFLLFARRYRAFVAAATAYVAVALFMTATYGWSAWPLFLQQQGVISRIWVGSVRNASLQGIVLRLKTPICQANSMGDAGTAVVAGIISVLLLALTARLTYRIVKRARHDDPRLIDVPFAAFTAVAVFVNPWIWEHYYMMLIQPAFVLAAAALKIFRRTLRGWLDETDVPLRAVVRDGLLLLLVLAGLAAIVTALRMNVYATRLTEELWRAHPVPWVHWHLHGAEITNSLPWVVMIVLSLTMAGYCSRVGSGRPSTGAAPAAAPSGLTPATSRTEDSSA